MFPVRSYVTGYQLHNLCQRSLRGMNLKCFSTAVAAPQVEEPIKNTHSPKKVVSSPPVAATVFLNPDILRYLQLKTNLRKTKILVSTKEEITIDHFKQLIATKYKVLENQPYRLKYKFCQTNDLPETVHSNEELNSILKVASSNDMNVHFFIEKNPGIFPPIHDDLIGDVDPLESESYTMVSFFSFTPVENTTEVQRELFNLWTPFNALGRIYVAKEGINAQMAIPTNVFERFTLATKSLSRFQESRFNTDPAVTREEYIKAKPFRALHIRIRNQIVADGFDEDLNWRSAGTELDPLDWHRELDQPNPILLDCRNTFESDVGLFKGALPLNTTFFRESWPALDEILKDTPKDKPIYTYCTGGIRCVKINAYLEQKLGFTNTKRLKGGVIAYRREVEKNQELLQDKNSKFIGVNYVFDERIVERITDDILSKCECCGEPFDAFINCPNCNVRFLQCMKCRGVYHGYCSKACEKIVSDKHQHSKDIQSLKQKKHKISNAQMLTRQQTKQLTNKLDEGEEQKKLHAQHSDLLTNALNAYSESVSVSESPLLASLRQETENKYQRLAARMLSGPGQGALLSFLATLNHAKSVLELGCFTGYSTLSLACDFNSFSSNELQSPPEGRKVFTCDVDPNSAQIAMDFVKKSNLHDSIQVNLLSAEEMIRKMRQENQTFDIAFLDADKKKYVEYLKELLGENEANVKCLLNDNALVIVDNTLWKGLVLGQTESWKEVSPPASDFGRDPERYEKIAKKMHEFNHFVASHPRLKPLMLPLRDGFTIIRYSSQA